MQENNPIIYEQIFYQKNEIEEKNNNIIKHKKNKTINTCSDLIKEINNKNNNNDNIKDNNNNIKYKINLEILYIIESKLQNILSKINNYIICSNECFDLITYYFSSKFYEKEINIFKIEQNKKCISNYIKFELLCYFLCYDVYFNKSFTQTAILLKLFLIYYIIII